MKWYVVVLFCGGITNVFYTINSSKSKKNILIDEKRYKILADEYFTWQKLSGIFTFVVMILLSIFSNLIDSSVLYFSLYIIGYLLSVYFLKKIALKKNYIKDIF